jgi:hypothetical protein
MVFPLTPFVDFVGFVAKRFLSVFAVAKLAFMMCDQAGIP